MPPRCHARQNRDLRKLDKAKVEANNTQQFCWPSTEIVTQSKRSSDAVVIVPEESVADERSWFFSHDKEANWPHSDVIVITPSAQAMWT